MPKRERDASGGGGGNNKNKKHYTHGHGGGARELAPGMRGALLTCDVHLEREAIKEAYRLFDSLLDAEAPTERADDEAAGASSSSAGTAGDALAAELRALQDEATSAKSAAGKPDSKPLSIAQTGCNGNVFIRLAESVALDPVTLVDRIMERARSGASGAPHVVRMLPVQCTCSARTPEAIAEAVAPLLREALSGYKGSYAVVWKRRCNGEIDKAKVIDALATAVSAVAPEATVDLNGAEAAIVAEVIKTTCSLSVLPRWREFHGYNLRAVGVAAANARGADTASGGQSKPAPITDESTT